MSKRGTALVAVVVVIGAVGLGLSYVFGGGTAKAERRSTTPTRHAPPAKSAAPAAPAIVYSPRLPWELSGYTVAYKALQEWKDPLSLEQMRDAFTELGYKNVKRVDYDLAHGITGMNRVNALLTKSALLLYEGEAEESYSVLCEARAYTETLPEVAANELYTIIFIQGVASLRKGENENCVECRGEGACLLPIRPTAVHKNPAGSRQAVKHFTEYLERFPDESGVRWLLNLAYMTLGEHPAGVPEKYRVDIDAFGRDDDFGHFKDVAMDAGLGRFNEAGGAIMDDFDGDGRLDLVLSSWDARQSMAYYKNAGDGTFADRSDAANLLPQLGGLFICHADYDNDGDLDIFVPRGAWLPYPLRPSLLRNSGDGTFEDVTATAGMMFADNSITSSWADYDNDGLLDLFYCSEKGHNRLFHNKGDGTFEDVFAKTGLKTAKTITKGSAWLDYDKDGFQDLFLNHLDSTPNLFHNEGNGTFTDVTEKMGITGPRMGFSCWAFDYDNDGWQDVFATSYERTLDDVVRDLQNLPLAKPSETTRLWRNVEGKRFEDVSAAANVDGVFATMGSNFADFDNDGYLDFYLATGDPDLSMLVPNRMFRNQDGKRFAEVTATAGTGHLQKGHSVACGDADRDGDVDMFVEVGGATPADRFHNALFQNPSPKGNRSISVKLVGTKSNRSAIGAVVKVVTAGETPRTVYRRVCSGSSFGGNALEQTIGLGDATAAANVEVTWPSGGVQVVKDVEAGRSIEITEAKDGYRTLDRTPIALGKK